MVAPEIPGVISAMPMQNPAKNLYELKIFLSAVMFIAVIKNCGLDQSLDESFKYILDFILGLLIAIVIALSLLKLDFNFYSFQNEIWDRDKKFFENSNLIDYSKESFVDIIGIIKNLDLVISTDTFFLHLACICNKETWGLISANSDWRWYEYYKYNPYKSLKIYKQTNYQNWDDIVYLIQNDLKNRFLIL